MGKFFEDWRGWILFILLLRVSFAFFDRPAISPFENSLELLLDNMTQASEENIRKSALEVLVSSTEKFPEYQKQIIESLKKIPQPNDETKQLLECLAEDPVFLLREFLGKTKDPILLFAPLCSLFALIFGFVFTILIPGSLFYFVGIRSIYKIFGRWFSYLFALLIISAWVIGGYSFYQYKTLILPAHVVLLCGSLGVILYLLRSGALPVFIGFQDSKILDRTVLGITFLALLSLVGPSYHYVSDFSQLETRQSTDKELQEILERIDLGHATQAVPLLVELLQRFQAGLYSEDVLLETLETMGRVGNQNLFSVLNKYLQFQNDRVRLAAVEAMKEILSREQNANGLFSEGKTQ